MNMSLCGRFLAVQNNASGVISHTEIMRHVTTSNKRDGSASERVAAMLAAPHVEYASDRAYAALRRLRKNGDIALFTEGDYDCFVEWCTGIAAALGIAVSTVEEGFLRTSELAINHARDAVNMAMGAYVEEGLDLNQKCGIAPAPRHDCETDRCKICRCCLQCNEDHDPGRCILR